MTASPVTPGAEASKPVPGSSDWLGAEIARMFQRSTRWIVAAIAFYGLCMDVSLYLILTHR